MNMSGHPHRHHIYRHYRTGGNYIVLETDVIHSESGEYLTIYMSLKDKKIWARPTYMWTEDRFIPTLIDSVSYES